MEKFELKGFEPFNLFWFKSCYYHTYLSVAMYYGFDPMKMIRNQLFGYRKEDGRYMPSDMNLVNYRKIYPIRERKHFFRKPFGDRIAAELKTGNPVVLCVDCYYLPFRPDCYLTNHVSHYIAVYGCDLERGTAKIVDHAYWGSFEFEHKEVGLANLVKAAILYARNFRRANLCTYRKSDSVCTEDPRLRDNRQLLRHRNKLRRVLQECKSGLDAGNLDIPYYKLFFGKLGWLRDGQRYLFLELGARDVAEKIAEFMNHSRFIWSVIAKGERKPEYLERSSAKLTQRLEALSDCQEKLDAIMEAYYDRAY